MSFKHPLGCNTILMDTCHPIKVSLTSDHGFSMNNVISNLYFPRGWKTNSAHEPQIQLISWRWTVISLICKETGVVWVSITSDVTARLSHELWSRKSSHFYSGFTLISRGVILRFASYLFPFSLKASFIRISLIYFCSQLTICTVLDLFCFLTPWGNISICYIRSETSTSHRCTVIICSAMTHLPAALFMIPSPLSFEIMAQLLTHTMLYGMVVAPPWWRLSKLYLSTSRPQ